MKTLDPCGDLNATKKKLVISIGSLNPGKFDAVCHCFQEYGEYQGVYQSVHCASQVSEQPVGIEETILGAKNRAVAALSCSSISEGDKIGVGIESGVNIVDDLYFDFCVCSIFDGENHCIGLSSHFLLPVGVVKRMFNINVSKQIGYNEAFQEIGIPADETGDGVLGFLSGGTLSRKRQMAESVHMSLVQYRNSHLYHGSGNSKH